jgi:hypothetical protein
MQCEQWARLANLQPSFGLPPPYLSSAIHKSAPRVSFTRGFSRPFPSGLVCIFTSTDSGSASCCRQLLLREPTSANVEFAVPRQCARECSHARPAHATPHCQHDQLTLHHDRPCGSAWAVMRGNRTSNVGCLPISTHQRPTFVKIPTCGLLAHHSTCASTERHDTIDVLSPVGILRREDRDGQLPVPALFPDEV